MSNTYTKRLRLERKYARRRWKVLHPGVLVPEHLRGPGMKETEPTTLYVDGGCLNNSDRREGLAYGSASDGQNVERFTLPNAATSNEAEFSALIVALSRLKDWVKGQPQVVVFTDSRLVFNLARWNIRAPGLIPLKNLALKLIQAKGAKLRWVPREEIVSRLGH